MKPFNNHKNVSTYNTIKWINNLFLFDHFMIYDILIQYFTLKPYTAYSWKNAFWMV